MEFNLSPSFLVNAGGALLFVVEGIAILAIGRAKPRALLLGFLSVVFGFTFIVDNLLFRGDSIRDVLILAFAAPTILATLALTSGVARNGGRVMWWALAATSAVLVASFVAAFRNLVGVGEDLAWFVALAGAIALLMMAAGLRTRARVPPSGLDGLPLGLLTLGFGLFGSFAQMLTLAIVGVPGPWQAEFLWQAGVLGICSVTLAGILAWAVPSKHAPWRLRVFLALGGAAALGIALESLFFTANSVYGLFGVMRTVGAACLAIAVVKYDLLGVPLPHFAVRRGVLATGALAALFITAQVAQNFFAAQYGLLMGGVVAGAVVFAASPIQRAMEAKSQRLPASPTAPSTVGNERREEDFRNAVRLALRDRRISVEEEQLLFRLAESLGVGAGRAHEIRHEVEARIPRRRL